MSHHILRISIAACLLTILSNGFASAEFRRVEIGHDVVQWFPVDVAGDGTYDLAIRFAASPSKVGVFDPASGTWLDGPYDWPFTGNEWGVADYDGDEHLEYAYRVDSSIYLFDPDSGEHTRLWTFSVDPSPVALFWGHSVSGAPCVGLKRRIWDEGAVLSYGPRYRESWTISVHEVTTGTLITEVPAGPPMPTRLYGLPSAERACLILHREARTSDATPHIGFRRYLDQMLVLGINWNVVHTIPLDEFSVTNQGAGPTDELWFQWAACSPTPDGSSAYFLFQMNGGYAHELRPGIFSYRLGLTSFAWRMTELGEFNKYYHGTAFDLDGSGVNSLLLKPSDNTEWERRVPESGTVLDSIASIPDVALNTFPLVEPDKRDLFYLEGSGLYIWGLTTGKADEETSPAPVPRDLRLTAYPNPFNGTVTLAWNTSAAPARIDILNILGQQVRAFHLDDHSVSSIAWDGRDESGRATPSGIYFARSISRGATAVTKIVLLK